MTIFKSILDQDLYKLCMGQAVAQKFPYAHAKYRFINRGDQKFTKTMADELQYEINNMSQLQLTRDEYLWLKEKCPYLNPVYLDLLAGYRFDQNEVKVIYKPTRREDYLQDFIGNIEITIEGPWYRTIYWEVPLLALISEIYHKSIGGTSSNNNVDKAYRKGSKLDFYSCKFADFGTRRRFSAAHQERVVNALKEYSTFVGTSNVYLAKEFNIKPIGTQAHEWIMFHGAKYGYREANRLAMKNWVDVYHGNLGIALTDTFGTDDFFRAFGSKYSKLFDGVRHDSGDPIEFGWKVYRHYEKQGIDPMSKTVVFSDGLDVEKVIEINRMFTKEIKCSFGIGTNLTCDIDCIKPMNIVIKMSHCKPYGVSEWLPVIKLSDDEGKHTGDEEEIELCKKTVGY